MHVSNLVSFDLERPIFKSVIRPAARKLLRNYRKINFTVTKNKKIKEKIVHSLAAVSSSSCSEILLRQNTRPSGNALEALSTARLPDTEGNCMKLVCVCQIPGLQFSRRISAAQRPGYGAPSKNRLGFLVLRSTGERLMKRPLEKTHYIGGQSVAS